MAKGARRKTKWVSLSLANTTTSVATGSDSEQQPHQQSHHHHGGLRQKTLNGAGTTTKYSSSSKELTGGVDSSEEHHSNEPLDTQSGNRTDTSGSGSGSDCPNGYSSSERRPGGAYHRRRPPPYHTRSSWTTASGTGSVTNGRGTYNGGNRTGYYNGGGGGYYGAGRRSYYDTHTRRPANATGTNKTTSGEGDGGGGGTTINDDEYTRITTPRQDVLFKKGYLSRPKPTTATTTTTTTSTSTENTASSSIAGTTSDGSDNGGNGGGSNSISTTASITSEFGGSFAADGSPLYDYPYPLLPCGYFTENGVLVMNGFAVDNNGYSYFNGGQTYIYPPNFNNCQQQPPSTPMPCSGNDETNANNPDVLTVPLAPEGESQTSAESAVVVDSRVDVGAGGDGVGNPSAAEDSCEVLKQAVVDVSDSTESQDGTPAPDANAADEGAVEEGEVAVMPSSEVPDYENGFYQFTDGYDFAQFWSSIYYPSWLMEQYPLYDDAGAPIYYTGEYPMPNGDAYTHQTSFKRRKKRFRTFEEIAGENGAAHDLGDTSNSMMHEGNSACDEAASVLPEAGDPQAPQEYQLNVDVQEFQPATVASTPLQKGDKVSHECDAAAQLDKNHSPRVTKKPPPAVKLPKSSSKSAAPTSAVGQTNGTTTVSSGRPTGAAMSHKIRKKDLIESTLAFAEQNIDLTRSKALASGLPSLDSELDCWTTIDRNGRKKRQEKVDVVKEKQVPANGEHRVVAEKVASLSPTVVEVSSAPIATISSSSSSALDTDTTITIGPLDTSNKKEQQITKSKKKTKSNKRQQHRKQHKQEGFQLIEPVFPSVASLGRHRARGGCENVANEDDQLETNDSQEEQEQLEVRVKEESVQGNLLEAEEEETRVTNAKEDEETAFTLEEIEEQRKEDECIEHEKEQVISEELNCDKANETVPAEAPPKSPMKFIGERQKAQDLVLATPSPPPSSAMAVVEEPIIVKKTENVMHHQQQQHQQQQEQPDDEEQMVDTQEEHSSLPLLSTVINEQKEGTIEKKGPIVQPPPSAPRAVKEPVPEDEKLDGTQSHCPAEEEQRVEMSTDRCVLTSAAKQLALSERPSLQLAKENDSDDAVEEDGQPGDAGGSDEDESRGKRGSVSGSVGYTESIDSGLQSPVSPCGGVASPEASSMVSSIESDETPLDQPQSEAPLSQIVAKWLLRKLEVHEPEEVFVLPSDPLLIERLERFQLLQRRSCRLRGGTFSSDSEDDVDDGSQEDSDSDYMSDGQGRIDRTADGDTPNLSSPVVSVPPEAPSPTEENDRISQKQLNAKITHHRSEEQEAAPMKPPVLNPSDSRSINSPAGAPRGAAASASAGDAKRCVIM
uniref:Uncharacterized protein n=1 Tax=Anopheles atroparvus TaxID=41427 RepID=A0AAG5DKY2_ANOAO